MQLKHLTDSPCGLRFVLDQLELQSGYARRWMLDQPMMTAAEDIAAAYDVLRQFAALVSTIDRTHLNTICFKLRALKDIRTTINNLAQHAVLDDIELFEVKHLAILAGDVADLLQRHGFADVIAIPELAPVIDILDPDGMKIATFYVYDSYCQPLRDLRNQMRKQPDQQDELLVRAAELEQEIRADLSRKLHPYAPAIEQAQTALAQLDVNLAKVLQMQHMGLCFPTLSSSDTTFVGLFHPQVKHALAEHRRNYQPVDITFGSRPTLITGANMGGKTVVLKSLTLCQYLFQFGFGIPAATAQIAVCDEIFFCIGDEQSVEKGLSSFAAEMKKIDAVIQASRSQSRLLALIDEPARTTNPTEGTALVSALLRLLSGQQMSLVMTTHYDIDPTDAHCLRVKGFENGTMNYALVEVHDGEVPHEALNIAQSLGIDNQWLELARQMLKPL